jgi:hypothetical protein
MTQQLAFKGRELERERDVAQEMRSRLQQLNQTYLSSGASPARPAPCLPCLLWATPHLSSAARAQLQTLECRRALPSPLPPPP